MTIEERLGLNMPNASAVVTELRRIADALEKEPETAICKPMLTFYCDSKQEIIDLARLLPKPLSKTIRYSGQSYAKFAIGYVCDAINLEANVPQNLTCTLIEPAREAVYECDPLFSEAEALGMEGV